MFEGNHFFFAKSDFHIIGKLTKLIDKVCEFQIGSYSKFLSKEQTLFLSISAFIYISEKHIPFQIEFQSNQFEINQENLISAFEELCSLYENQTEIIINSNNFLTFKFLSECLDNQSLAYVCHSFLSSNNQNQVFFLTSKRFSQIPSTLLDKTFDFVVQITPITIRCNSIFASCISNAIAEIKKRNLFLAIDFSTEHEKVKEIIIDFFAMLKCLPFIIHKFKKNLIREAIKSIGFISLTNFVSNEQNFGMLLGDFLAQHTYKIEPCSFLSLSLNEIEKVFSSSFLVLHNGNQLFDALESLISQNRNQLFLIKYVYFPCIHFSKFINFTSKLQIEEILKYKLVEVMKNIFHDGYFISNKLMKEFNEIEVISSYLAQNFYSKSDFFSFLT
jgi:hypothetical protein